MAKIIKIDSITDSRVVPFCGLTETQLRKSGENSEGYFIAESPKVINVAINAGYTPISILCENKHITGDAAHIIENCPSEMPLYTGDRELLKNLTGYTLTRGVLALMHRPAPLSYTDICNSSKRVAVLESICDTTNIGAIFRSAAALGIDGILLTPDTCDPLNRRAIRVSMGSVFLIPWAYLPTADINSSLHEYGFKTIALALTEDAIPIDDTEFNEKEKLAMILGTEGDGLRKETITRADMKVIIPMANEVDSLNVAAASAITFWHFRPYALNFQNLI